MKYFKYKIKNNDNLVDIESKIADIIYKIVAVIFIGALGLIVSISNLKLNSDKVIYELLDTTTKQIEESKNLAIDKYSERILFAQKMSGVPLPQKMLLESLSSNDPQYQQINKNFLETINQLRANTNDIFENINLTFYILIITIFCLSLIYTFFQVKTLIKLFKYKKIAINNQELARILR